MRKKIILKIVALEKWNHSLWEWSATFTADLNTRFDLMLMCSWQTVAACDQCHQRSGPAASHSGEVCAGRGSAERGQGERRQSLDPKTFPSRPRHIWVDLQAHRVWNESHTCFCLLGVFKKKIKISFRERKVRMYDLKMTLRHRVNVCPIWQHAALGRWALSCSVWEGRSHSDTREKPEATQRTLLQPQLDKPTEGEPLIETNQNTLQIYWWNSDRLHVKGKLFYTVCILIVEPSIIIGWYSVSGDRLVVPKKLIRWHKARQFLFLCLCVFVFKAISSPMLLVVRSFRAPMMMKKYRWRNPQYITEINNKITWVKLKSCHLQLQMTGEVSIWNINT